MKNGSLKVTSQVSEPSLRVYERAGFVREGEQREFCYRDGRRWYLVYYGILRDEWIGSLKS